jgi:hypothetical protein
MTTGEKIYSIASPKSIQVTAVNILNGANKGNGRSHYGELWLEVEAEIKRNGRRSTRQWNGQIGPILKKAGGYTRLCSLSLFDAEQTFKSAYQDAT